jgi:Lrp/AsnC family transcriptional regulator
MDAFVGVEVDRVERSHGGYLLRISISPTTRSKCCKFAAKRDHFELIVSGYAGAVQYMTQIRLDRTDRRILDVLQTEANLSAAEIGARIGVAPATCWRRITRLEQSGVIKQRVAILDRAAVGLDLMVFAHVKLSTQGRDAIAKFGQAVRRHPEVLECHVMMGDWDFLLRVVTKDVHTYEQFFLDHLSKLPFVQSITSSIALTEVKHTTQLPV